MTYRERAAKTFGPEDFTARTWWKESIVYQIYPPSFMDSNGDGWGDLKGVTSKLDYLKNLGVDIIWLSPIHRSPKVDMGYDISDYLDIDPCFGTLEDFDNLVTELDKRGMKLMMDLVVNHTSDQHYWFQESRSSVDNKKRDWYIWKDPIYDKHGTPHPPNNWGRILDMTESAWEWDENTQQYYLSLFSKAQPDLNWENVYMRAAIHDMLRFWLEKGIAGFRMDVINLVSKSQDFPNAKVVYPEFPYQPAEKFFANGPRLHEFLHEMRAEVLDKYDTITVGEIPYVNDEDEIIRTVQFQSGGLNMIFIFDFLNIDMPPGQSKWAVRKWDARDVKRVHDKLQRMMIEQGDWNTIFIENHDTSRSLSRYTNDSDEWRDICAKLLAMKALTLGGTSYIYQGEELGMRNVPEEWGPEEYKDVESQGYWKMMTDRYPNNPEKLAEAKKMLRFRARDNTRTPMQWDYTANAGFCPEGVKPWMRVNDDYKKVNAAVQYYNEDSVYGLWKKLIALRKEKKDVFVYGYFEIIDYDNTEVVSYRRYGVKESYVVVLNFTQNEVKWDSLGDLKVKEWLIGNYAASKPNPPVEGGIKLRPWEGLIGICNHPEKD